MAGNTYQWLGGSNTNDAATLANWQVLQGGSFVTAGTLPGTLDTVTLANGGLINDSGGDQPLTALTFVFTGSGGTLEVGNLVMDRNNGAGSMNVGTGAHATLLTTGSVEDDWQTNVSGSGASLDIQAAGGSFTLDNALFATNGAAASIGATGGGSFEMDGGAVAYGGTLTITTPISGNGQIVVGSGDATLNTVDQGELIVFIDTAGTVTLSQTGTVGSAILGFQAGDAIDLTALSGTVAPTVAVNGNFVTLSESAASVVLPLPGQGFTAGSFTTTNDGSGHLLLRTTLVDVNWLGGATGSWNTAADWSTNSAPTTSDNAVIANLANTFEVTASNDVAQSLLLTAPNGTLLVTGGLTVNTAIFASVGVVAVTSGGFVSAGAFDALGGTLDMSGGQMVLNAGQSLGTSGVVALIDNGGVLLDGASLSSSVGGDLIGDNAGGSLTVQDFATLSAPDAVVTGQGTAIVQDGGLWSISGNLMIGGGNAGTQPWVQLQQGTLSGGTLLVGGTIDLSSGTLAVLGGSSANAGSVVLSGGGISVDPSGAVLNIGTAGAGGTSGVVVDAGATLTLSAGAIDASTLTDNGLILDTGSGVLQTDLAGTGTIDIAAGATLMLTNNQLGTVPIDFTGSGSMLILQDPGAATNPISIAPPAGSGTSNTIDINTLTFTVGNFISYDAATGGLAINGGGDGTLHVGTGLLSGQFNMVRDSSGDTAIIVSAAPCFAAGAMLATPEGERPVEQLRPGDTVLALADGAWVPRRVRWVGRTTVDLARHPDPAQAAPIRIRAGAIADGVPHRDLLLSPEHAVFIDGVLMQAQPLLNGATVTREMPARVTYFHVELDRHSVLCAQGLPAESYLDTGNRGLFAAEAGVRALHPDFAGIAAWSDRACAPLVLDGPVLSAAQMRLRSRAVALGHRLTDDPALAVRAGDTLLLLDARGRVTLPPGTREAWLLSRSFVPSWLGLGPDRRRLGVAAARLRLGGRPLPAAAFGTGWYAAEPGWRWTDGAGQLRLPALLRPAVLTVQPAPVGARYWADAPDDAVTQAA